MTLLLGLIRLFFLASNSSTFESKYRVVPFGQFTRNLSNKSQKIVLADADGNIIDSEEYFDAAPWPTTPDGGGSYVKLISTALDNNLASSWETTTSDALSRDSFADTSSVLIYPNPVEKVLTIQAGMPMTEVKIFNRLSALVQVIKVISDVISMDLIFYSSGVYFVKLYSEEGFTSLKIIKN